MNLVFLSLLIGCSGCKPKPQEKPPVLEEETVIEEEEVQEKNETEEQIIERMVANFQRVYFDVNSSDLNAESRAALDENLEIMQAETQLSIEIQGHADDRGTTEYNVTLGQKRAEKIAQHFTLQGIAQSRINIVSYGEEKPVVKGSSESIWSQNRRCEFVIVSSNNPDIKGTVE
ncbi:MAG: peptidoglycan-associated lipoprotein [Deltaproteobacteria bacterium]|nr:peptidoglycan-associated lipoprotein [Deltaproteobacteria bacterium]